MNDSFIRLNLRLPQEQIDYLDRARRGVESRANYIRRLIDEDQQLNERSRRPSREQG